MKNQKFLRFSRKSKPNSKLLLSELRRQTGAAQNHNLLDKYLRHRNLGLSQQQGKKMDAIMGRQLDAQDTQTENTTPLIC